MGNGTSIGRVRGLGAARSGTKDFWHQRVTSVAGVALSIALIVIAIALLGRSHAAVVQILGSPIVAIIMGMITAAFGGIIRDTLAGEPSIVLGSEIYISASALAGGLFVLLLMAGVSLPIAAALGFAAGFTLRAGALAKGWSLPSYRGAKPD